MPRPLASPVPAQPLLVEGAWRFERPPRFIGAARATAHHLIHLVDTGGYVLALAGRRWDITAPALIWYHGAEAVGWHGDHRPVTFLSCAFACPGLSPPPAGERVVAAEDKSRSTFIELLAAIPGEGLRAHLQVHIRACAWLTAMLDAYAIVETNDLWQRSERHALAHGHVRVADLASWAGVGVSTLERACHLRHGCSPGRRLRELRLAQAEALISQGGLSTAQTAERLGWSDRRSLRRARGRTRT